MSATQPMTQLDNQSDEEEEEDDDDVPWGKLIPLAADPDVEHLLRAKPSVVGASAGDIDVDVHSIGRNEACDVVVRDSRISGFHCRIYRRSSGYLGRTAYVEDCSSNGTFLNRKKLPKREPFALCNGDHLALVSPKKDPERLALFVFVDLAGKVNTEGGNQLGRTLTTAATDSRRRLETDYDIRDEIGSGAIGKVYRAVERKTGTLWAVKIVALRHFALSNAVSLDDMLHEARMLHKICHPGIVSVHDVYSSENAFSLVMQLVQGGDLFDRILKRGRYPENDARGVMRNLLSALTYLHDRSIAHRDIKPENILLRSSRSDVDVLLTDFGLAKHAAVHDCRTFCGTPQYLAPEVLSLRAGRGSSEDHYDGAAADIWSLGVVLFVMLCGAQPDKSDWLFFESQQGGDNDDISLDAKDAIRAMTTISPSQRPPASKIARLSWFSSNQHQIPEEEGGHPWSGDARTVKRRKM